MSLNIKNPETHRLAAELAEQKGLSMTQVITDALRKELAESDPAAIAKRRAERALAIAAEIRAALPPGYLKRDFDSELYDPETGLPR